MNQLGNLAGKGREQTRSLENIGRGLASGKRSGRNPAIRGRSQKNRPDFVMTKPGLIVFPNSAARKATGRTSVSGVWVGKPSRFSGGS